MFYKIIQRLKIREERKKWRKNNAHNQSELLQPIQYQDCIQIGKYTYGGLYVINHNINEKLLIGNFCSIAPNVCFVLSGEHNIDTISTYPYKVMCLKSEENEAVSKGDIIVDDDVWIGYGATIMSGVRIGQGAVIAAGAIVTKDVPPYAIVGGVPAKIIKYRFSEEMIRELLKVDYSQLDEDMVREHIDDLYENLTDIKQISWMPRKK